MAGARWVGPGGVCVGALTSQCLVRRVGYLCVINVTVAFIALCRDRSTRHLDGYKPLWTGRSMDGWVVDG